MSEYCLNCEATERKLAFYVEQVKKMGEERDAWKRDAFAWETRALKAREALITIAYDSRCDTPGAYAKAALALFPKEPSDNG